MIERSRSFSPLRPWFSVWSWFNQAFLRCLHLSAAVENPNGELGTLRIAYAHWISLLTLPVPFQKVFPLFFFRLWLAVGSQLFATHKTTGSIRIHVLGIVVVHLIIR